MTSMCSSYNDKLSLCVLIVQDERPKPTQQFAMRFGAAMDKVSVSRNSKILSKELEKEKSYEGQRLPMSPIGILL